MSASLSFGVHTDVIIFLHLSIFIIQIPAIMSNLFLLEFLELTTDTNEADEITIMDTVHTTLK